MNVNILCRDLRAELEVAISKVYNLALGGDTGGDSEYISDSEDATAPAVSCNRALTSAVRKDLATALADLFQHGLMLVRQPYHFH